MFILRLGTARVEEAEEGRAASAVCDLLNPLSEAATPFLTRRGVARPSVDPSRRAAEVLLRASEFWLSPALDELLAEREMPADASSLRVPLKPTKRSLASQAATTLAWPR